MVVVQEKGVIPTREKLRESRVHLKNLKVASCESRCGRCKVSGGRKWGEPHVLSFICMPFPFEFYHKEKESFQSAAQCNSDILDQ